MHMFFSTRGGAAPVSAPEAVLKGIATDGGLYIRNELPQLSAEEVVDADFRALSKRILGLWMEGYTGAEIDGCVERAYADRFDAEEIVPIKSVGPMHMLELFHGPTAAFKDVALSLLPQLMRCAAEKCGRTDDILILTATSGDTGSAALKGFADVPGVKITVFYPDEGISPIQRAQMTTMAGDNLGVCAIRGNFDDAQNGVKNVFVNFSADFARENAVSLSSANSINIGRLMPQIVYYYSAYLNLVKKGALKMGDKLNFSVPTGNFGDILAGYLAKRMGLPVGKLICASNANNVLTDFMRTGVYDRRRDFHVTTSPSMDILVSSNLERLVYYALGEDAKATRQYMEALKSEGVYQLPEAAMAAIRADFCGDCADDAAAAGAIAHVFRDYGYLMDPHTAVAWRAAERQQQLDGVPCVVLATASPYKFPQSVLDALGQKAPADAHAQLALLEKISSGSVPAALNGVLDRPVRFTDCIDPVDMMRYVMGKAARRQ